MLNKRIHEWVRFKVKNGKCREKSCDEESIVSTHEGDYCLMHYMKLEDCFFCGEGSSQYVSEKPVCVKCFNKKSKVILSRSSLSKIDETPGHENFVGMGRI